MFYGVVEFTSRKSTTREFAVVPLTWLIKNERRCYWPTRTNKLPFSKFVKECTPPNKHWPHYNVNKVHFKTESYESAEEELNRLLTEYEELNAMSTATSASVTRKSVPSDSDSDTTDDTAPQNTNYSLHEPVTKRQKPVNDLFNDLQLEMVPTENLNQKLVTLQNSIELTPSASSTSTMTRFSNFEEALRNDIIIDSGTVNNTDFQNTVLQSLASIQTTNNELLLTMQEILRYNKKIALEKLITPGNLPAFPIKTYDDFVEFETLIQEDPQINQYLVRRLAALGGSGIEAVTRRIMKFLLANQLAIQFNWKGRYHKMSFEKTSSMNIIYEAAKLNFPVSERNDFQIAWAVKEWLKHASTRINQSERQKKVNQQ